VLLTHFSFSYWSHTRLAPYPWHLAVLTFEDRTLNKHHTNCSWNIYTIWTGISDVTLHFAIQLKGNFDATRNRHSLKKILELTVYYIAKCRVTSDIPVHIVYIFQMQFVWCLFSVLSSKVNTSKCQGYGASRVWDQ
jgi:hypothetical protein